MTAFVADTNIRRRDFVDTKNLDLNFLLLLAPRSDDVDGFLALVDDGLLLLGRSRIGLASSRTSSANRRVDENRRAKIRGHAGFDPWPTSVVHQAFLLASRTADCIDLPHVDVWECPFFIIIPIISVLPLILSVVFLIILLGAFEMDIPITLHVVRDIVIVHWVSRIKRVQILTLL